MRARKAAAGRKGALVKLALYPGDLADLTAAARKAFLASFEARIPPAVTDPIERQRRAEMLRRAHFQDLSRLAVAARRRTGKMTTPASKDYYERLSTSLVWLTLSRRHRRLDCRFAQPTQLEAAA